MARKTKRAKNAHKRTAKRKKKVAARKRTRSPAKVRAATNKPVPRKRASQKRATQSSETTMRGRSVSERKLIKFARSIQGRRIALLFDSRLDVPQTPGFGDKRGDWKRVRALGAADLVPIFSDVDNIDRIEARARKADPDYPWPRFRNAFLLHLKPGADTQGVLRILNDQPGIIRWAHEDPEPGPAASTTACNVSSAHLNAAQVGVGAQAAWDVEGGLGEDQICADVEQGWVIHARLAYPGRVELLCGTMLEESLDHGTQVLGILGGSHPPVGCRGLAPEVAAFRLASYLTEEAVAAGLVTVPQPGPAPLPATSICDAFAEAIKFLSDPTGLFPNSAGGVLLIERQEPVSGLPIEILPELRDLIRAATHTHGITVVEPAGNGYGQDLDLVPGFVGSISPFPLAPQRDGDDSGAIMVGSASSVEAPPGAHRRLLSSNLGSRVNCYAWGDRIRTPTFVFGAGGSIPALSTECEDFGMTSGAAAIIAGVALVLQGIAAAHGVAITPKELRDLICDPQLGTPAVEPVGKPPPARIGSMPDLAKILGPGPTAFPARFGVILRKRLPS